MVDIGNYFSLGLKNANQSAEYKAGGGGLFSILSVVLRNVYVLAGIILLIMIFAGGLGMILNSGNPEKTKQGSKTVTSAITGFVILFSSYWIIKIIELIFSISILDLWTFLEFLAPSIQSTPTLNINLLSKVEYQNLLASFSP